MTLSAAALLSADAPACNKKVVMTNEGEKKRGLAALFPNAITKKIPTSVAYKPL